MPQDNPDFQYFLSENHFFAERGPVVAVSFIGKAHVSTLPAIRRVFELLTERRAKWLLLNFRDLQPGLDPAFMGLLSSFKVELHSNSTRLRLVAVHPEIRKQLLEAGLVSAEDISNNFVDAMKVLLA